MVSLTCLRPTYPRFKADKSSSACSVNQTLDHHHPDQLCYFSGCGASVVCDQKQMASTRIGLLGAGVGPFRWELFKKLNAEI